MPNTSDGVEREIKARLADLAPLRSRLPTRGARLVHPRELEVNDLWDTPEGSFRASGRILRVRRYGEAALLTFKGKGSVEAGLRSRPEEETAVADPAALERILLALGYVRTMRYEKYREVWRDGELEIVLDETPLGPFVEIEGEETAVRAGAEALGIREEEIVPISYASLWRLWREEHPEAGADMLFDPPAARPDGSPAR